MIVIKRDGREVPYSRERVLSAVFKAMTATGEGGSADAEFIAERVERQITGEKIDVEAIQDIVERQLMEHGLYKTAKAYCVYRDQRSRARDAKNNLMKKIHEIVNADAKNSDVKRENANIDGNTAMGAMLQIGSACARTYNDAYLLRPEHAKAHREGDIHIHDADFYAFTTTCCQIDLLRLFHDGFSTGHGYLREPQSIRSYAALAAIAIQANQCDQHGGQSVPNFDYAMAEGVAKSFRSNFLEKLTDAMDEQSGGMRNAEMVKAALEEVERTAGEQLRLGPSVRFDELLAKKFPKEVIARVRKRAEEVTERDTYQAMEGFVHNMNTLHSRAGAQVPFSSVNYGTDTSPEGRMVIKNLLLALEAGLGHGETCIFPIHIFKVKEGVNYNEDDPNYDLFRLSCRVSAKRLFPNYVFLDSPYNLQYYKPGHPETEVATMGAVTGDDLITLKLDNRQEITLSFKTAYERYSKQHVKIADRGNFVKVLTWHKYEDAGDWYRVTFSDGKKIQMTSDHPLPTQRGRVECKDLRIGDWVPLADMSGVIEISKIEFLGYAGQDRYDVTTSSDRFDVSGINSHNCRTRVMGNVHDRTKEIAYSRGNLSFTTINLPRLGIESHGDEGLFYEKLDGMLEMVSQQLLDRFEIQASKHVYNFPFLMGQGVWLDSDKLRNDDEIREVLKHGTLSIGFIGLAETLTALYGHHHGENEEMQKKGLEIISHMREFCDRKTQEHKMNFTLLATPAESLSGRFIRKDNERYGSLPGVTDREYYTNSFHIPVWFPITAYEKIKLEAPYHALCNAGHISYVELDGDTVKNVEAFESIIRWMHDCQIGYGSINHPVDRDPICGFVGVINDTCPRCGRKDGEAVSDEMLEQLKKHYPYLPIFRGIE